MIIGDNIGKVDPYDMRRTVAEYVDMVRTAEGPEKMVSLFIEAKGNLRKEEYRVLRLMTKKQIELLLECGALLRDDF